MKTVLVNRRVQVTVGIFLTLIVSDRAGMLLAQSERLRFTRFTVENGLAQNSVQSIFQDRDGFLWFGTGNGLSRYDGDQFTTYDHVQAQRSTWLLGEIGAMTEDREGNLWFLVRDRLGGLKRRDKSREIFTYYNVPSDFICVDDSGMLWLEMENLPQGVLRFDPVQNKIIQRLPHPESLLQRRDDVQLQTSHQDRDGAIWLGTNHGEVLRLSRDSNKNWQFQHYTHHPACWKGMPPSLALSIQALPDGDEQLVWVGMNGGGLCRMRLRGQEVVDCEHFLHDPANPRSLSSNFVDAVFIDKTGTLWVGTNGGGLCKLIWNNADQAEFIRYQNDAMNPASLSDNHVISLYQDRSGMMWAGTNGGGVNKFDPAQIEFRHDRREPSLPASLPNNRIWAFFEDRAGNLWIGADSSLIKVDRNANHEPWEFATFSLPPVMSPDLSRTQVRAIWEDRDGTLWIGSLGNGLGQFDRAAGKFTFYHTDITVPPHLRAGHIYALYGDSFGTLWIGMNDTNLGGFVKMWQDQKHGLQFKNYLRFGNGEKDIFLWVTTIHPSRTGRALWLGTWDDGLLRFDPQQETFTQFAPDSTNLHSLCHTIYAIYEDSTGVVWAGSNGGGLDKLDPETGLVKHYTTRNGLADNVVYGILPDAQGNLWMSTNHGLSKFNPRTEEFQNFDMSDGLQGDEFNLGAALRTRDGELFFGGNNGFNHFYPAQTLNTTPPEILLTRFKKHNKAVAFATPLANLKKITLSPEDDFFTFEFAALHYKNPAKNRYAYMMEGFDRDWIHIGNKREASYTNLAPGEYTFRVKAANSDGVWNEKGLAIQVEITPPYWKTWWFVLLMLVAAIGAIVTLHRYRVRQKLALEREKFRERETIQKKIARDVHDDFGSQLSQISVATSLVKRQAAELPAPALETLEKIAAHATALSQQMKDFIWNLDPEKDTLYHLAEQWKNFSDTLFEPADIAFQLAGLLPDFDAVQLPMEWKQHLHLIFKEAMNNISKHAANCTNVTLAMALHDGFLQVNLTNDGEGFDAATGRCGNGLQNMRHRAQELGGRLEILSEKTGGTTVRFIGKLPERPVPPSKKFAILKEALRSFRRILRRKAKNGIDPLGGAKKFLHDRRRL